MDIEFEVFAVGVWNGMKFTVLDLQDFADNFKKLKDVHSVPLKFGHNDEQKMTDGQPALGWVVDVFVSSDDKLMVKAEDVPLIVHKAIDRKLYKKVSIEADFGVEHKGVHYANVLSGVALLGADIPAVNTIADLKQFMGREGSALKFSKHASFTAITVTKQEGSEMPKTAEELEAENKALRIKLDAKATEDVEATAKFAKDKATFETEKKEYTDKQETAKFDREKKELTGKLDGLVKASKITPAKRDDLLKDFSRETADRVTFAVDMLSDGDNKVGPGEGEQGMSGSNKDDEGELEPSEEMDKAVRKFSRENKVDYSEAITGVVRENPDLARKWNNFNEEA